MRIFKRTRVEYFKSLGTNIAIFPKSLRRGARVDHNSIQTPGGRSGESEIEREREREDLGQNGGSIHGVIVFKAPPFPSIQRRRLGDPLSPLPSSNPNPNPNSPNPKPDTDPDPPNSPLLAAPKISTFVAVRVVLHLPFSVVASEVSSIR